MIENLDFIPVSDLGFKFFGPSSERTRQLQSPQVTIIECPNKVKCVRRVVRRLVTAPNSQLRKNNEA